MGNLRFFWINLELGQVEQNGRTIILFVMVRTEKMLLTFKNQD